MKERFYGDLGVIVVMRELVLRMLLVFDSEIDVVFWLVLGRVKLLC